MEARSTALSLTTALNSLTDYRRCVGVLGACDWLSAKQAQLCMTEQSIFGGGLPGTRVCVGVW